MLKRTVSDGLTNDFSVTLTRNQKIVYSNIAVYGYIENIRNISTEAKTKKNANKDLISKLLLASDLLISSFRETARYVHLFILVPNPRSNTALRYHVIVRNN